MKGGGGGGGGGRVPFAGIFLKPLPPHSDNNVYNCAPKNGFLREKLRTATTFSEQSCGL